MDSKIDKVRFVRLGIYLGQQVKMIQGPSDQYIIKDQHFRY